ncbi:hypothetical protein L873DRAFT_1801172 [Choiromyces venosus 120613-1]|uniref:Uncharacterized protein n=1 Tax=Choiromyces venosus 120613-1 TaxID=1336337 RepID=A0A3N4JXK0_9PEZI|nr:hypothetical protein L873DRAFT_1801172 [Choiromyces venosus 120613-1]
MILRGNFLLPTIFLLTLYSLQTYSTISSTITIVNLPYESELHMHLLLLDPLVIIQFPLYVYSFPLPQSTYQ